MGNIGNVSAININGNEMTIKDEAAREVVNEIISAIGANNSNIAERINDLHGRSFDYTLEITSNNESEIISIQDGIYKLHYVTVAGSGDNEVKTLNNSAILIQKENTQYLYKDGKILGRTKTNNSWGEWQLQETPHTLSSNYETSSGKNTELFLEGGDTYEEAFGKIEKAILDNEEITANSLIELNSKIDIANVSWLDLKNLRDNGNLIPGQLYRITDYVTTTVQAETQSAGHQFDIIVTADANDKLNENAYATIHSGDSYFANSKLESWELKYCLDNDTNRFAWADEDNGKGVIYWMKDEFFNECGYDFKNIMFARYKITAMGKVPSLVNTYSGFRGVTTSGQGFFYPSYATIYSSDKVYRYTFDLKGTDYSLIPRQYGCHKNVIAPYKLVDNQADRERQFLNNITFANTSTYVQCNGNKFESMCHNMAFGNNCYSNTFGDSCSSNTFGNDCYSNTFGNNCYSNTFGNNCYSNTFGNYYNYNTFGNNCYSNTFGNYYNYNTFGNSCSSNTFGDSCYSNTFGNNCNSNIFGNNCYSNIFGNNCYSNTFGNNCYSNTFGNSCSSNTFGNSCSSNTFGDYCYFNTFGNSCGSNTFGDSCYFNTFGNNVIGVKIDSHHQTLFANDEIYQKKDNIYYPLSHPDLSTQPSILPQRFGNLDIKEILIPLKGGNEWDVSKNIPSDSFIIECSLFSNDAFASPLMRKKDGKWYLGIGNVYTDIEPKEWWALVRYVGADNGYYGYYGGQGYYNSQDEIITIIDDTDDGVPVDLGLPSGTLWVKSNLGATKPSEYGLYFQWGDTQGYTGDQVGSGEGQKYFGWADYKYGNGGSSATDMTKYNSTDHLVTLEASDDAVYVATNGAMKMPTEGQMEELYANTDVSWIKTQNGVYGRKFTNKSDSSKYIFFPAAGLCGNGSVGSVGSNGYCWSSSLCTSSVISGRDLNFLSGSCSMSDSNRYYGFAVRGVVG